MKSAKLLGVFVAGMVLAGCSAATDDGRDSSKAPDLPQGVTVLSSTDVAVSLAYRKADVVIYMQALRGKLAPQEYQNDPDHPRYEVDARFDADNGRTFYSRRGGDRWIDETWAKDFTRQNDLPPTSVSDEVLFDMAAEASALLDTVEIDNADGLRPVLGSLHEFARSAPAMFVEQKARRIEMQVRDGLTREQAVQGEVAYGTPGPEDDTGHTFGSNYYYIAVHHMDIAAGFGMHSATRLYAWNGDWVAVHDACNHGDCASTMSAKCLLQYYEALDDYKPNWTFQNCATGYDWDSDDGHNCHDDTRLQMNNFVYGGSANYGYNNGYQGWCSDGDSDADISCDILFVELDQNGSPDCNSSTNRGYNHPWWSPYQPPPPPTSSGGTCAYLMGCAASWMGVGDGCDCEADGSSCGDPDCGGAPASTYVCDYTSGCASYWMGVGDGCDCEADGSSCGDPDCG